MCFFYKLIALLIIITYIGFGQFVSDEHTVSLYHFDEISGDTVYDASGNGNNGIVIGTNIIPGFWGNAREFNGSPDKIEIPAFNPDGPFTIEAYVNIETPIGGEQRHPIIGHGVYDFDKRGYLLWILTDVEGKTSVVFWANSDDGNTTIFLLNTAEVSKYYTGFNEWHHIAGVWDGNKARVYVDGELWHEVNGNSTTPIGSNDYPTLIGSDYFPTGNEYIYGKIDEVKIYSRAKDPLYIDDNSSNYLNNYSLFQNYPNPFNPITKIKYSLPETKKVTLKIFDILGKEVTVLLNEIKSAGNYEVEFDGTRLPSGVYFYQFRAGNFVDTKKLLLMK